MHVLHPQFPTGEEAERIYQTRLPLPDGLDFRTGQHDSCGVRIDEFIIERCPLVLDINIICNWSHQFKITDNLLNTDSITIGESRIKMEATTVYDVSLLSAIPKKRRAPSNTTNTVYNCNIQCRISMETSPFTMSSTNKTVMEYPTNTCSLSFGRYLSNHLQLILSSRYAARKKPPNKATATAQQRVSAH